MDRLRARLPGSVEDPLADEIALGRRAGADQVRLVGGAHVQRIAVRLRVDRDRRRCRARAASGRSGSRSRRDSQPALSRREPCARVFSRSRDASGSADRRPRRVRAPRRAPLRLGLPEQRVLGDGRLLRRDGHRLARRPDRAQARRDLAARLAARSDRRQGARPRGARDADRGRSLAGAGWSPRSWRASF